MKGKERDERIAKGREINGLKKADEDRKEGRNKERKR